MWPRFGLLFLMGAMQAVIGWWMVYSGLQQKPSVSHYRLATHLMSAFTLFAFTFWFALGLIFPQEEVTENDGKKIKKYDIQLFNTHHICVINFIQIYGLLYYYKICAKFKCRDQ